MRWETRVSVLVTAHVGMAYRQARRTFMKRRSRYFVGVYVGIASYSTWQERIAYQQGSHHLWEKTSGCCILLDLKKARTFFQREFCYVWDKFFLYLLTKRKWHEIPSQWLTSKVRKRLIETQKREAGVGNFEFRRLLKLHENFVRLIPYMDRHQLVWWCHVSQQIL